MPNQTSAPSKTVRAQAVLQGLVEIYSDQRCRCGSYLRDGLVLCGCAARRRALEAGVESAVMMMEALVLMRS
ncbi:hypothetical protein M378DRAFT_171707 [Amanita muscaria Koide BX008]|uniref:Uncharacterized protein n=1 Tax=Amanita muscaria (strain Koide BX008) TaxID=946122 RepID=A0A0C2SU17_AMAMK|nr:hypothetical protein M378DRAFT_171707 [Amanita muscaria Koide BX008]